ncbi:MAG: hypothetical protein KC910_15955 [Candidatus Eremiobacteraeota bacterium]|nr:hypothetical protein [Candidatus Eremiobacteraeota bacterium]
MKKTLTTALLIATLAAPLLADTPARTSRDPFVLPARAQTIKPVPPRPQTDPSHQTPNAISDNQPEVALNTPPELEASLTGIVVSSRGNQALVTVDGATKVVSKGDRLGAWTVRSVGSDNLELAVGDARTRLMLQDDFGLR